MEIRVGDTVRSFDFDRYTNADGPNACYVEGVVEEIGDFPNFPNCPRYRIRCTRQVFAGLERADGVGREFYPPVNGTPSLFGDPTSGVARVD